MEPSHAKDHENRSVRRVSWRRPVAAFLIASLPAIILAATTPTWADSQDTAMEQCFGKDRGQRIEACTALLEQPISQSEKALAYAMRALAYSVKGQYQRALPDYDRAIELRTDFAIALNNRAWAHYKLGNIAEGFKDVERSLKLSPGSAHALDTRAHLKQSEGNAAGAVKDYRRAMVFGGSRMVRMYQCGLQTAGYFQGPLSGIVTPQLIAALETCAKLKSCDPLPPDEECRRLTS
ncbi:MAG: tetratricopeptide repeat protein [Pseudomonadota bacterium]